MAASKTINVDFYQVETGTDRPFMQTLEDVERLPNTQHRTHTVNGFPIRLAESSRMPTGNVFEGDLVKIRMDNLPVKASIRGGKENIDMADDEGIGEETAFAFVPDLDLLIIQRHRLGVTASAFCTYFEQLCELTQPIELLPIIHPDALLRLQRSTSIRSFEVRLARVRAEAALAGTDNTLINTSLSTMDAFDSPTLTITLGTGRQKRHSLVVEKVIRTAKSLLRTSGQSCPQDNGVDKLRARCVDADGVISPIDFLRDKVFFSSDVEMNTENRRISYERRKSLVREAWSSTESSLRDIIQTTGD